MEHKRLIDVINEYTHYLQIRDSVVRILFP